MNTRDSVVEALRRFGKSVEMMRADKVAELADYIAQDRRARMAMANIKSASNRKSGGTK